MKKVIFVSKAFAITALMEKKWLIEKF